MARRAIVAGQFYEDSFEVLNKQIEACFKHKLGPGELPAKRANSQIKGAVVPHAGYMFSGPCAAWAYKAIAESTFADAYIILGNTHSGSESCVSLEDWETPLGTVQADKVLAGKIMENTGLKANERAHAAEHSIEVQLPFLQFASKDNLKQLRIVPIMVAHGEDYRELGEAIKRAVKESGKNAAIIASSDFTHYGVNYGYVPFSENIKESLEKLDKGAIAWITKLNSYRFIDYVEEKCATICGMYAIAALIDAIAAKKARLLQYYSSGDIVGDYSSAVGYAAITFK